MSSGPNIPRSKRKTRNVEVALRQDEAEALDTRCEATGETKTAVIRQALRRELGLDEAKER